MFISKKEFFERLRSLGSAFVERRKIKSKFSVVSSFFISAKVKSRVKLTKKAVPKLAKFRSGDYLLFLLDENTFWSSS